jgi:hypothetical protein
VSRPRKKKSYGSLYIDVLDKCRDVTSNTARPPSGALRAFERNDRALRPRYAVYVLPKWNTAGG